MIETSYPLKSQKKNLLLLLGGESDLGTGMKNNYIELYTSAET